jgi:hypothetical protein
MPKCVKCNDFFPPNYTEIIEDSEPMFDGNYPQECIFCRLGIDEVERESEKDSGQYVKYTKKECLEDYKKFLRKVKDSKNVKDILNKQESRIILP